jgi:small Trp-rich protein
LAPEEVDMPIIIAIAALLLLKYFDVWIFAEMSWWWPIGLMGVAFIWFEFLERMLGMDKRKSGHEVLEKARKERVRKAFEKKK